MMWWSGAWGWEAWLAMALMMAAFWGVLIWAALAVVRSSGRDRDGASILAERFARGEIDDDEFRRRRELLRPSR